MMIIKNVIRKLKSPQSAQIRANIDLNEFIESMFKGSICSNGLRGLRGLRSLRGLRGLRSLRGSRSLRGLRSIKVL